MGRSNGDVAPLMAEGRAVSAGGVAPPAAGVRMSVRENFEIANAKSCILMHFQESGNGKNTVRK